MNIIVETDRLLLRTFTLDDSQLIYELNLDPDVIRFTMDPINDIDHAKQVLEKVIIPQYVLYNHGRWAVHLKHDLEFIGWCGLKTRPERNEIDLGYRFMKKAWGKGYATEAAYACIKYGFEKLNLNYIVGRAMPDNVGSLKVLEKCGMIYKEDEIIDGHPSKTFKIYNPFIIQSGLSKKAVI
ncbi:MAG: GNAT family N-acetyltransferase [Chitinophagaceae bacterium]